MARPRLLLFLTLALAPTAVDALPQLQEGETYEHAEGLLGAPLRVAASPHPTCASCAPDGWRSHLEVAAPMPHEFVEVFAGITAPPEARCDCLFVLAAFALALSCVVLGSRSPTRGPPRDVVVVEAEPVVHAERSVKAGGR